MPGKSRVLRALFVVLTAALISLFSPAADVGDRLSLGGSAFAQDKGRVPGSSLGNTSDSQFWRAIRGGARGNVSIPDKKAGILVQSGGESWRSVRNGPLSVYSAWALLGIVIVLAVFFAIRGRIKIDSGMSGKTVERFNSIERFSHWLCAISFIVLALSGLNLMYGRYFLLPILGPEAFSAVTMAGKYAHNYVAFAFMISLIVLLVLWARHNIPDKLDLKWLAVGGGLFKKGVHPAAKKFNAGQKILFWVVILGGLSISLSGLALLFPFQINLFDGTFAILNGIGLGFERPVGPLQEMQLSQIWHAIVAIGMIVLVIAHIYIGTLGMEGAVDAMWSGQVDRNWAKEHHSLWVAEAPRGSSETPPAEPSETLPAEPAE